MLRALGVRVVPRAALAYLIAAVVLLVLSFVLHLIQAVAPSTFLEVADILIVATGIALGIAAIVTAARNPGS